MSWSTEFSDLIPGLRTLRDAAEHISSLPKAQQQLPHWQTAVEVLILVAESGGDTMLARIAMLQAMNHGKDAPREPRKKAARKFRIVR